MTTPAELKIEISEVYAGKLQRSSCCGDSSGESQLLRAEPLR